jgi:dihydrofolate reductase
MSVSNKVLLSVKIYEEVTETHEVIMDKKTYDKLGQNDTLFDYISEKTLVDKEYGDNTDYQITKVEDK